MTSPSDHPRIHQLPEFEECGHSPSFEYGLPVTGMRAGHREVLSPWIRRIADLNGEQAHAALRERWSGELSGPLGPLLDYLLQFRPAAVVVQDQRSWLMALRPDTESTHSTFFLLPDPVDPNEIGSRLNACGICQELLTRFLVAFAGLREDFPPSGGAFIHVADDWFLLNQDWMQQVLQNYGDWEGALVLFTSRGGDGLLIGRSGEIGWWGAGEDRVTSYAQSFEEFCEHYTQFRINAWRTQKGVAKLIAWPFNAYQSQRL